MNNNEKMYHIGLSKDDIKNAKYALLTGDPERVDKIANILDNPVFLCFNREYKSYLAYINKEPVLIISTGIGGPSMAICVEELNLIGIQTIIRVGTSGGMQSKVLPGDIVIATSAIRAEGTSLEYLPIEFPAVASFEVTKSLELSAKEINATYHIGVVHCKDSFYGQHNPNRMPVKEDLLKKWNSYINAGALCSEMETSALFSTAQTLGLNAGAVLLVIWNQEVQKEQLSMNKNFDINIAVKVSINAIRNMIDK